MTGKKFDKDLIAFIYVTVLATVAVIYGFSVIPSPQQQRDLNFDNQRSQDISDLQSGISNYFSSRDVLPLTLDEITQDTAFNYGRRNISDPLTKKPYEYIFISDNQYRLCTEFATDSNDTQKYNFGSADNYSYPQNPKVSSPDTRKHPKGHYCFDETVIRNKYNDYLYPTSTEIPTPTIEENNTPNNPEITPAPYRNNL